MRKYLLSAVTILILFSGCDSTPSTSQGQESSSQNGDVIDPINDNKLVIYQMMIRLFGNTQTANIPNGTIDENGVGKFSDINEAALSGLKDLGATHVWYTGVIEHATMVSIGNIPPDDADVVKGRAGSPYAIKDYYDVNPYLADEPDQRMQEFESLVSRTHSNGLGVIIDFVPNHVARSYRSDAKPNGVKDLGEGDDPALGSHPNNNFFYITGNDFKVPGDYDPLGSELAPGEDKGFAESPAKATGNNVFREDPSVNDWFETVKLNYGGPVEDWGKIVVEQPEGGPKSPTWIRMKDILLFWCAKGVDGFRCDMAEMVPVSFWNWAIQEVKREYPNTIFIAEIYNPGKYEDYMLEAKFDYLYDKVGIYDAVKRVIREESTVEDFQAAMEEYTGYSDFMLRFMENHDEQRIMSPDFAGNAQAGLVGMALSACLSRGPVLHYFGQEVAEPGKGAEGFGGEDGRTTIFDFWGVPEHQKWVNEGKFDGEKLSPAQKQLREDYKQLYGLVKEHPALNDGGFVPLNVDPPFAYAFFRYNKEAQKSVLFVANFDRGDGVEVMAEIDPAVFNQIWYSGNGAVRMKDLISGREAVIEREEGAGILMLEMPGLSYAVFELLP